MRLRGKDLLLDNLEFDGDNKPVHHFTAERGSESILSLVRVCNVDRYGFHSRTATTT